MIIIIIIIFIIVITIIVIIIIFVIISTYNIHSQSLEWFMLGNIKTKGNCFPMVKLFINRLK